MPDYINCGIQQNGGALCKNGHPRSESRITPKGGMLCVSCERISRNKYYNSHKETRDKINALNDQRLRRVLRARVEDFLGGVCVQCGFTDRRALQIDHKFGGGSKESRRLGRHGMYKRIFKHRQDYQLLCANCNMIKRVERGEISRKHLPEIANAK